MLCVTCNLLENLELPNTPLHGDGLSEDKEFCCGIADNSHKASSATFGDTGKHKVQQSNVTATI